MKEKMSSIGSIITAFLSAVCWLGIAIFASLGLSGVGAALAGSLSAYRPYFLAATFVLLGFAHYMLARKPGRSKWNKVVVWGATVLVLAQVAYSLIKTL